MPNWKKVLVSGSDAALNTLTVSNGITGSLLGTSSFASTASFVNPLNQNVTINGNLTVTGSASNSLLVKGSGATSATNALSVLNSSNTTLLTLKDNGAMIVSPAGGDEFAVRASLMISDSSAGFIFQPGQNYGYVDSFLFGGSRYGIFAQNNASVNALSWATGYNYQISGDLVGALGVNDFYQMAFTSQYNAINTTGDLSQLTTTAGFAPSSGTASFSSFRFRPTINQTSTATGATRGVWINPILTSAPNWRSVEWSNNTGFGLYGSGSAHNLLRGNTTIGTFTTGSSTFNVSGSSDFKGNVVMTGSLNVTGGITGSLLGTASYASQALSASFASTASSVNTLNQNITINGNLNTTGSISGSYLRLSSSFNTAVSGTILTVIGSGSAQPIFTVQGSQGELFSVTDSLSGSLFSVNDISGLPILEVFSDNTTLIGDYQSPALITTKKVAQTNSGSFVMYSVPTASYDGAFIEYTIKSGSNARAGTIMSTWAGSTIQFTETTTLDVGSTTAVGLTMILSGSNAVLTGSSSTGAWTIKTIVRAI